MKRILLYTATATLLLACVLLGMVPSLLSVASTRMSLPLLAMLLPGAGVGLATLAARRAWLHGALLFVAIGAALWLLNPTLPGSALGTRNLASAHYRSVARGIERVFGAERIAMQDRIFLRRARAGARGSFRLTILTDGYLFGPARSQTVTWADPMPGETEVLKIRAPHACMQLPTIELTHLPTGRFVRINAVQPDAWRQWRPTGLGGIEYAWAGSAGRVGTQLGRGSEIQAEDEAEP